MHANGDRHEKQEEEVNAYKTRGDADQDCEGDARGELDMHRKQGEEADAFVEIRDTGQQCEENTGGARHFDKLHSSRTQDPEARHPGTCPITGLRFNAIRKGEKDVGSDRTCKKEFPKLKKKGQLGSEENSLGRMLAGHLSNYTVTSPRLPRDCKAPVVTGGFRYLGIYVTQDPQKFLCMDVLPQVE
ncbi:hypothetical protein NDU88_000305 [Pleurodeles waltl]|uniref:Uncharacterized protein n=1 Tax=Pleurodeles waltl TaxID=8319 RepID=A0AAV7USZ2_PLEWA|nr:hypothetical protein NDU88_000305 [Pleurodeles waltl]